MGGRDRLDIAWVSLAAAAVGVTTLGGGFVYDDVQNVVQNEWLRDPSRLHEAFTHHVAGFDPQLGSSYYRPLIHLAFAGTYALFGLAPWAFHLVNALLHVANSILALLVARRLFRRYDASTASLERLPALATALLFASHPVHAEAIAWISGIPDLSAAFFVLIGLLFYLEVLRGRSPLLLGIAAGASFLGTLCKETAFVLPALLVVLELARPADGRRSGLGAALLRMLPLAITAGISLGLRWNALGGFAPSLRAGELGPAGALADALWLLAQYVGKLVLPVGLNALHPYAPVRSLAEGAAMVGLALAVGLVAAAWALRRHAIVPIAIAIVVLPLLPVLHVPVLGEGVLAERYLYLPVFGFALLAGWGLARVPWTAARWTALAGVVTLCVAMSVSRNAAWSDSVSLWTDSVRKAPSSAAAREYLCVALLEAGRVEAAAAECREALRLDPARSSARTNLAASLAGLGRLDEALDAYGEALRQSPGSAEALTGLGLVQMAKGWPDRAIASYRAALASDPGYAEAHNCLGVALIGAGRAAEGIEHLRRAVEAAPENPDYDANLSAATARFGLR